MNEPPAREKPARAKPARPVRLDPLAVRRQLREEGLRPHRSLSQNFLADPDVLQSILDLAAPAPGSRILEIGPGLGILTRGLIASGAEVTAVELDGHLADRLRGSEAQAIESGSLRLVQGDILDQDLAALISPPYEVVANVPYHITSPILHRFLGRAPRPSRLVLMLQREVAERIAAESGGMSYLTLFVQYHASVEIAFRVPRQAFEPAPEVDSAVVVIEPRDPGGERPILPAAEEDDLWRLIQSSFHERRKMLRNVLTRQLPISGEKVEQALAATGIDGQRRPQTLSLSEWLDLRQAIGGLPAQSGTGGRS